MPRKPIDYIFVHTTASGDPKTGKVYDISAKEIDQYHKSLGWDGIGYHYVIRMNGQVEVGRPYKGGRFLSDEEVGAHVEGLNEQSLGIAISGHGDIKPMTEAQLSSLINLLVDLIHKTGLPVGNVLGHKEVNTIVQAGLLDPRYKTSKTCPGIHNDMTKIREKLMRALRTKDIPKEDQNKVREAFRLLYSIVGEGEKYKDTRQVLNILRYSEPFKSILDD
jgi:N-acetyl-anhydromuramyl-L-alanine amidase AmpD